MSAPPTGVQIPPAARTASLRAVLLAVPGDESPAIGALAAMPGVRVIGVARRTPRSRRKLPWFSWLPPDATRQMVASAVTLAFENIDLAVRDAAARADLARAEREMRLLHEVGIAISAEHESSQVLKLILRKAREITGADAGSIYIVEERHVGGADPERVLSIRLSENDSIALPAREVTLPVSEQSIAGHVALHGRELNLPDVYRIAESAPYRFHRAVDDELGYRTVSLLTLPMKNTKGEVLGVLQLINCRRNPAARLSKLGSVARQVRPFPRRMVQMMLSLASQAAVSYQNAKFYQDIESLFEGFVRASVTAIEQRDPTTSGHSLRVSRMTCGLAGAVDRVDTGVYAPLRFTAEQMREIRYAALLHDFGKVAVREEVLVKAKKLYPTHLTILESRFDYARKELEARYLQCKLEALTRLGPRAAAALERLDRELAEKLAELDGAFDFVLRVNEPTILPQGDFERLHDIARHHLRDPRGSELTLLTPEEVRYLSIPQGSLDQQERKQIESHVEHSFHFLMQIPWTRSMREIPAIARAHHEKLNGSGYPHGLKGDAIPVQAKIMTICDIFDALSASDRPYKKAVTVDRALEILEMSVRDNELDPVLFQLFLDAKIYELMQQSE